MPQKVKDKLPKDYDPNERNYERNLIYRSPDKLTQPLNIDPLETNKKKRYGNQQNKQMEKAA